jgi:putative endonuclease
VGVRGRAGAGPTPPRSRPTSDPRRTGGAAPLPDPRHALGAQAERLAADHLERRGYRVIDRNYRYRGGELDLVARDGDTLVFVEVRARRSAAHGAPFETVGREKQRRVARTAEHWLVTHGLTRAFARFDVVSVLLPEGGPPSVEIIVNAFES